MYVTGVDGKCMFCGAYHTGVCPEVAEIEYYTDGSVKRVVFRPRAPSLPFQSFPPVVMPQASELAPHERIIFCGTRHGVNDA